MKTIRCNQNFLSRYNYLKKSGKKFKISKTSSSHIIEVGDKKYIYSGSHINKKEMIMQIKIKSEIVKNLPNLSNNTKSLMNNIVKTNYFKFHNKMQSLDQTGEVVEINDVWEMDITKAYYQTARNLGFISDDFYQKCLKIPKSWRLRLLGSIATKKIIEHYDKTNLDSIEIKTDKVLRSVWDTITNQVDKCMSDCSEMIQKHFLFYWVDGIYFVEKSGHKKLCKNLINFVMEQYDYECTIEKLDRVEAVSLKRQIRLYVYKDGKKKSEFSVPKKRIKKSYLSSEKN
jgi:hypothetical protein|tara:strand:- start:138 stop:995 length:858 start_codon:yes stop_codon:yes gene_type:complete